MKENTDSKKKKRMKKEKNTDRTQITVNAPHVRYDVKALPQYLIIRDKYIPEENFERKVLGIVFKFSREKSFKI